MCCRNPFASDHFTRREIKIIDGIIGVYQTFYSRVEDFPQEFRLTRAQHCCGEIVTSDYGKHIDESQFCTGGFFRVSGSSAVNNNFLTLAIHKLKAEFSEILRYISKHPCLGGRIDGPLSLFCLENLHFLGPIENFQENQQLSQIVRVRANYLRAMLVSSAFLKIGLKVKMHSMLSRVIMQIDGISTRIKFDLDRQSIEQKTQELKHSLPVIVDSLLQIAMRILSDQKKEPRSDKENSYTFDATCLFNGQAIPATASKNAGHNLQILVHFPYVLELLQDAFCTVFPDLRPNSSFANQRINTFVTASIRDVQFDTKKTTMFALEALSSDSSGIEKYFRGQPILEDYIRLYGIIETLASVYHFIKTIGDLTQFSFAVPVYVQVAAWYKVLIQSCKNLLENLKKVLKNLGDRTGAVFDSEPDAVQNNWKKNYTSLCITSSVFNFTKANTEHCLELITGILRLMEQTFADAAAADAIVRDFREGAMSVREKIKLITGIDVPEPQSVFEGAVSAISSPARVAGTMFASARSSQSTPTARGADTTDATLLPLVSLTAPLLQFGSAQ